MLYKNVKTGAVITVHSAVKGEDWQEVKPVNPSSNEKPKRKSKKESEKGDE